MARESTYLPVLDFAVGDVIRGVQAIGIAPLSKNFNIDSVPARIPWSASAPEGLVLGRIGALHYQITGEEHTIWVKTTGTTAPTNIGWRILVILGAE